MEEIISKAATLLEALPYIQRFRSQIFVVKYGGSFMDSPDPEVRHRVARDVVFLEAVGINPVVVHGGGKAITRALEAEGSKAEFVQGHRVTNAATAEIVRYMDAVPILVDCEPDTLNIDLNDAETKIAQAIRGELPGIPSTVIDLTSGEPRVLRHGSGGLPE